MKKSISPLGHGLADYALVASLLVLPTYLELDKTARKIYAAEALGLLAYVGATDHPASIKPLIPFPMHGRIDPFNVLQFAMQSFAAPFRRDRRTLAFNLAFTAVAGALVLLTDWHGNTRPVKRRNLWND